eukprot:TRINITY_DN49_c0_g1_i6.p1 TRINITY_DN49_c0_g1~~TRINITY_DN49_c0_g1_i6.p1  ORF type:complete len:581 (-),score=120.08 TRINITY_DN49_c0_g1_i6:50-1792(-)
MRDLSVESRSSQDCVAQLTPLTVAPEVISESGHNTLSDIWSLACTIYELLTGMPPYFKVNPMTAMFKIVQSPIPIPEHISAEMRDLFSYCFRKAPQERPPAADLLTHPWFAKAKEGPLAAAFRNMKDYASMRDVIAQCAAQQGAAPVVPSPVKAPQVKSPVPQSPIDFTGCGSPPDHERSLSPDPESVDQEKERSSGSGSGSSGNGTWSKDNGKDSHKHKLHHHHGQARGPSAANPLESFFQPPHSQQPLHTSTDALRVPEVTSQPQGTDQLKQEILSLLNTEFETKSLKVNFVRSLLPRVLEHTTHVCSLLVVGRSVWVGGEYGTVAVWRADSLAPVSTLGLHATCVRCLLLVEDRVVASSEEGTIHIIDTKTLRSRKVRAHDETHKMVKCLAMHEMDGVAPLVWSCAPNSSSSNLAVISKRGSAKASATIPEYRITVLAQHGACMWACSGSVVLVLDHALQLLRELDLGATVADMLPVGDEMWVAGSRQVVVFSKDDQELARLDHPADVMKLCLFQNLVLTADVAGAVLVWDPFGAPRCVHSLQFPGPASPVTALVTTTNYAAWAANASSTVCVWSAK